MERQTSVPRKPGPGDWESSAPSTKPFLRTNVYLSIFLYVLPVIIDYPVNIPLSITN